MGPIRLGDDIDDFCIKCKRLTNHVIIALVDGEPAKVRCRTCYNEGPYRKGEAPPSKKDLKKAALFNAVLESIPAAIKGEAAPAETPAAKKKSPGRK
jgi:hypothetical protein